MCKDELKKKTNGILCQQIQDTRYIYIKKKKSMVFS